MDCIKQAQALRDFFSGERAAALRDAAANLANASNEPAPEAEDWEKAEFDFNKLFVGPAALLAPPYASVYLDPEPLLMGKSTLVVRKVYQLLGLESPDRNSLPDDHIALELDACVVMLTVRSRLRQEELEALCRYFIVEHMARWTPRFTERVRSVQNVHPVFEYVANQLDAWLRCATAELEPDGLGEKAPPAARGDDPLWPPH